MLLLERRHHCKLFTTNRIYHLLRSILTLTACASGFAFGTLIAGAPLAATVVCSSIGVRDECCVQYNWILS